MPAKNNLAHISSKLSFPTFRRQSIEVVALKQFQRKDFVLGTSEDRSLLELTYTFSDALNSTVGYEYIPTNSDSVGKHFANVGAGLKQGALSSRCFLGQTSGGTRCSGGVCRVVPPYTGAMLETTYTF